MTDKEINRARNTLLKWNSGIPLQLTEEQKRLSAELDCRDMINSCLIYGTSFSRWSDKYNKILGRARVEELYNEQKSDFDKATVYHNVYTDFEGVTYNSIKWADEEFEGIYSDVTSS